MPRITLTRLTPGDTFVIEVRASNLEKGTIGQSNWSQPLEFTVAADETPPSPVGNLTATLDGYSLDINWDQPTTNADASVLDPETDLNGYELVIYQNGAISTDFYRQTVLGEQFSISVFDLNNRNPNILSGTTNVDVTAIDYAGNRSTTETVTIVKPALNAITLTSQSNGPTVTLEWTSDFNADYYEIHRSETSGFTPDGTTLIRYSAGNTAGAPLNTIADTPSAGVYYYQVVAIGLYGTTATSNEVSGTVASINSTDTVAPSTPDAPTITGGTHSFTVNHNLLQSDGTTPLEDNTRFIYVYASDTTGFTADETTYRGSIAVGDDASVEDTFVNVIATNDDIVYVKVRAGNRDGFVSAASAESSATITAAGSTYIANAAIGDAQVNNLSAGLIRAGTTFTNDLNVESQFTINAAGIMQTSNYSANTSGWRIDGTGDAFFNNIFARGTIDATAGSLQNLDVFGTITVGDGVTNGAIESSNYVPNGVVDGTGTGWALTDQTAEFNNVLIRGDIYADNGTLGNMRIEETITVGQDNIYALAAIVHGGTPQKFSINQDGTANFQDANIAGAINATSGSIGNLAIDNVLTMSGTAAKIRTSVPGDTIRRIEIDSDDILRLFNSSQGPDDNWEVSTTGQGNILFDGYNAPLDDGFGGIGLAVASGGYSKTQFISKSTTQGGGGRGIIIAADGDYNTQTGVDAKFNTQAFGWGFYLQATDSPGNTTGEPVAYLRTGLNNFLSGNVSNPTSGKLVVHDLEVTGTANIGSGGLTADTTDAQYTLNPNNYGAGDITGQTDPNNEYEIGVRGTGAFLSHYDGTNAPVNAVQWTNFGVVRIFTKGTGDPEPIERLEIGSSNINAYLNLRVPSLEFADGTTMTTAGGGAGLTFPILADNGTAGAPSYSFSSDNNTGIYRFGENILRVATGGGDRLSISNTGVSILQTGAGGADLFVAGKIITNSFDTNGSTTNFSLNGHGLSNAGTYSGTGVSVSGTVSGSTLSGSSVSVSGNINMQNGSDLNWTSRAEIRYDDGSRRVIILSDPNIGNTSTSTNYFAVGRTGLKSTGVANSGATGSSAVAVNVIDNNGANDFHGIVGNSTSNRDTKFNLEYLTDLDTGNIIDNLRPLTFNYLVDKEIEEEGGDSYRYISSGLVIEDVLESDLDPRFLKSIMRRYGARDDGAPSSIEYKNIIPFLIEEMRRLRARVAELEAH